MSTLRPDSMFLRPSSTLAERAQQRLERERGEENGHAPVGRTLRVSRPPAPDHVTVITV